MSLNARKNRLAFEKEWQKLKDENDKSRLMLEVPRALALLWRAVMLQEDRYPRELVAELEDLIRSETRGDWGSGSLVMFNRKAAKVAFIHTDGRRMTVPIEN